MDIVRGSTKNVLASEDLIEKLQPLDIDGTLYLGYPLLAQDEMKTSIDALLVSKNYGLIAFTFESEDIENIQDELYFNLEFTLRKYGNLRKGRKLAIEPVVISYLKIDNNRTKDSSDYIVLNSETLVDGLKNNAYEVNDELYSYLIESLQKIASIKPRKKRKNVKKNNSLGAKIKYIEKEVANLDEWQKKAAFEIPDGIQRIRGLAGSGKTVVLALKAAYLHFQYPDWDIAVTFYTRSLGQQFKEMINNFYREYTDEEFDEDKLHILHSWGTAYEKGIYSEACLNLNVIPTTYQNAQSKYGRKNAFSGIVNEVLPLIMDSYEEKYDIILIDEAQDMPANFFELCYKLTKHPRRIVYAYDELQNLNEDQMPTLREMFGTDEFGQDEVELINEENKPRKDIVLPICYRNSKWALTMAHSLGFGIYRNEGNDLVQFFNDLSLWKDIGYEIKNGQLENGKHVVLERSKEASPSYFDDLMTPEEAVKFLPSFTSKEEQYNFIADSIKKNIEDDELDPDDILVIFPDPITAKNEYTQFRQYLLRRNISSNLAGVTTSRDIFKSDNYVTCASIYRAKGNEAPIVYVVNADFCAEGSELIKLRNILFTAITRSRGWVRVSGTGLGMDEIFKEYNLCVNKDYCLDFIVPTTEEIEHLRKVHRELSAEEKRLIVKANKNIKELLDLNSLGALDDGAILKLKDLMKEIEEDE
ncbi:DEAD/DEAH box helicase [Enterococcus faecium]|uniref:DEAD/DEAH box helicase n=1 Tax=Enterococcus faecium TaxID=1352 RepID=UPI00232BDECF|nr:ATP-binding domain-containing protein [Enterococcus faecium]MDB1155591.1 ATP-binding domain-containing protein [Enterococcus faecium]